ncbi:hypothetical protein ACJX0J_012065, partial [Zea mays]
FIWLGAKHTSCTSGAKIGSLVAHVQILFSIIDPFDAESICFSFHFISIIPDKLPYLPRELITLGLGETPSVSEEVRNIAHSTSLALDVTKLHHVQITFYTTDRTIK